MATHGIYSRVFIKDKQHDLFIYLDSSSARGINTGGTFDRFVPWGVHSAYLDGEEINLNRLPELYDIGILTSYPRYYDPTDDA